MGGDRACGAASAVGIGPRALAQQSRHLRGVGGSLELNAIGRARRPPADFRAAVGLRQHGGNGRRVELSADCIWDSHSTTLSAAMTRGGDDVCRDTRHTGSLLVQLRRSGGRIAADLSFRQLTRTSCPGPSLTESDFDTAPLASGTVPRSALRHARLTLHMRGGAPLESEGWSGRAHGSVTIVLRRTRVSTTLFRY